MLVSADKFYGVLFNNQKISSIRSIKREEAMEFVDQVCYRMIILLSMPKCLKYMWVNTGGPGTVILDIVSCSDDGLKVLQIISLKDRIENG